MKYTTYMVTVGIDEVGRGCWAGPLVAGAVILNQPIAGLKDSKKLSKAQRENLSQLIYDHAFVGLGWVGPAEIDEIGLTKAVGLAMTRALALIRVDFDEVIIDGNINFLAHNCYRKETPCYKESPCKRVRTVVKADTIVPAVSAASIVAKVARDAYMATKAHELFPMYEFCKHVGYGTKLHLEMLKLHGVSPMHRKSYKPIQALMELA